MSSAELTPKQLLVLNSLLGGESITTAARSAGVHRATIYLWRQQEAFNQAYEKSRCTRAQAIDDHLSDLSADALCTLHSVLNNTDVAPSVRLKAALAVLNAAVRPLQNVSTRRHSTECDTFDEIEFDEIEAVEPDSDSVEPEPTAVEPPIPARRAPQSAIPRNASCPCGSKLKFKRCCGKEAPPVLSNVV